MYDNHEIDSGPLSNLKYKQSSMENYDIPTSGLS